jgi:cobalt-zinc-cadmium efflux system outer membrane protein
LSVQDRERLLAAAIREQGGRYLEARRTLEVMNEALATIRRTRDLLERRANEGEVPKLDANLAAVEVGRLEADQALATADADVAAIELKTLAGLDPGAPLALRDSLESLVPTPPPTPSPEGPETALQARPDIREASTRVALADARLAQARREGRWDMTLSGSYSRMHFGFSQRGFDQTGRLVPIDDVFHSVTVSAKIAVPLWHRNQGDVATAQADRNGAEERLAARERSARGELLAALTRDREARRAVEVYASAVRGLARQNVDVLLQSYDLGRTPLSDLLAGQRRYLEVEAAYTSVLSRAWQAGVALRRARGEIR